MNQSHQLSLLGKRRFLPFFATQFLGAFNDNIYKNTLLLMAAFAAAEQLPFDSDLFINLGAGLFILPFFIFSGIAGQIADKYEKSLIIRRVKLLEIAIMVVAAGFIISQSFLVLLILLFLMGTQSAFFGPVKYAIIPQHLHEDELVGGNALVEMGTFVAILLGTLGAGLLVELTNAHGWIAVSVVVLAILGWLCARQIPEAKASAPDLDISYNLFSQTRKIMRDAHGDRTVYISLVAISWFWAIGAAYLTQLPNLASQILSGSPQVVSIMLAVFTIGVAAGSLFCGRISHGKVEPGIVPLGALGLSLFALDLFFAISPNTQGVLLSAGEFIRIPANVRVLFDLAMIGFSGGLFIVPLYAMVQKRTEESRRARTIAALNVMNSSYMVGSAVFGILFLGVANRTIEEFFLILAVLHVIVSLLIFKASPEFWQRFKVRFSRKVS